MRWVREDTNIGFADGRRIRHNGGFEGTRFDGRCRERKRWSPEAFMRSGVVMRRGRANRWGYGRNLNK